MNADPQHAGDAPKTTLEAFVTGLLQNGAVVVAEKLSPFEAADMRRVAELLGSYHEWDAHHMPGTAPEYHAVAAVWAAGYLYRAIQYLLIRELEAATMDTYLMPYPGDRSAEAAYSADLCLRSLPRVHALARSLSPQDPLVLNMQETARQWPFSGVGIVQEEEAMIPDHPSLRLAFADRVIAARDRQLSRNPGLNASIQVALGGHAREFWPDFEPIENTIASWNNP
ncbi:MAG: hypothetical protein U0176_22300 [Bacteroidia bacterium]